MTILSRRVFALMLATAPVLFAGCAQRVSSVTMKDVVGLAADALLTTALGTAPERRSVMTKPEPALLQTGIYETIAVTTDVDSFVRIAKGAISAKEIQSVEKEVVKVSGDYMKNRDDTKQFSIRSVPYPVDTASLPEKTLLATFTPETEEGGSPEDRQRGKGKTYVLFRLTVTNPQTGAVLRVREFYSGRDAGVKP